MRGLVSVPQGRVVVPPSPFLVRRGFTLVKQYPIAQPSTPHKYGYVGLVLPESVRKVLSDWTIENVPEYHVSDEGYEFRHHITVKYGFREFPAGLDRLLIDVGPIQVRLLGLSLFTGGKDGDVLKIDVDSPQLMRLNGLISDSYDCHDSYSDYIPHVTLAYLLPEFSHLYEGKSHPLHGTDVIFTEAEYS